MSSSPPLSPRPLTVPMVRIPMEESHWELGVNLIKGVALRALLPLAVALLLSVSFPPSVVAIAMPAAVILTACMTTFVWTASCPKVEANGLTPPGLYNQSANCWINSLCQMIWADQPLRAALLALPDPPEVVEGAPPPAQPFIPHPLRPFKEFLQAYERALLARDRCVPDFDSQTLRECLSLLSPLMDPNPARHMDPTEAFNFLMDQLPALKQSVRIQRQYDDRQFPLAPRAPVDEPMSAIPVSIPSSARERELSSMLQRLYFNETIREGSARLAGADGIVREYSMTGRQVRFIQAPSTLWVSLSRFVNHNLAPPRSFLSRISSWLFPSFAPEFRLEKVAGPIAIPSQLRVPCVDGSQTELALDAFLIHRGETQARGHYISYRREGENFYKFDDACAERVTPEQFQKASEEAYCAHYSRN